MEMIRAEMTRTGAVPEVMTGAADAVRKLVAIFEGMTLPAVEFPTGRVLISKDAYRYAAGENIRGAQLWFPNRASAAIRMSIGFAEAMN